MWLFEENTYFHLSSQVIHSKKKVRSSLFQEVRTWVFRKKLTWTSQHGQIVQQTINFKFNILE